LLKRTALVDSIKADSIKDLLISAARLPNKAHQQSRTLSRPDRGLDRVGLDRVEKDRVNVELCPHQQQRDRCREKERRRRRRRRIF